MLGLASFPAGKHASDTHCWPPQSKPNISSLHPTLYPSDFRQNSASALLMLMMCFLLRGSRAISLSLNSVKESSSIFCSPSSADLPLDPSALYTITETHMQLETEKFTTCNNKIMTQFTRDIKENESCWQYVRNQELK